MTIVENYGGRLLRPSNPSYPQCHGKLYQPLLFQQLYLQSGHQEVSAGYHAFHERDKHQVCSVVPEAGLKMVRKEADIRM